MIFFGVCLVYLRCKKGNSLILLLFFKFRLVVSSLEALESCFAVGSSNEKVNKFPSLIK